MTHPCIHAQSNPDKPAVIMGDSGETISYRELDRESNRLAHLFRQSGLQIGDTMAICMENHPQYFVVVWAAQRAGLIYVAISSRLTAPEVSYILSDSGSKILISSAYLQDICDELRTLNPEVQQMIYGGEGARDIAAVLDDLPDTPIDDEQAGIDMLYSSGTTGRPKGVRLPLPEDAAVDAPNPLAGIAQMLFHFTPDSTYLSPAPLYHAAPLRWSMVVHRIGGTVVVMEKFDPEQALALIEKHKVDISQWVPTHFVRMLKLPEETRARYDVSSLNCAIHAAAPCPVTVKETMINWWGPVLMEYYAGSEGNGFTFVNSENWMSHKGTVGQPINCQVHICGEDGEEVSIGDEGQIFFESDTPVNYHNDPEKTAEATHANGWTTLGDVGKVDEEGFLYLTDRKSFMIITGGVNVYPQEIENLLVTHPKLADAAVIGAPDPDMGEKVVAVVQPLDMADAGGDFAQELEAWMRQTLSGVKIPRQIDFREELPRHPTGKLYKRLLRDEYWGKKDSKIV